MCTRSPSLEFYVLPLIFLCVWNESYRHHHDAAAKKSVVFEQLRELFNERIVVLDGAMGTEIQNYELDASAFVGEEFKDHPVPLEGNNDILVLTKPDLIQKIHLDYFKAGADIVETNTFSSTTIAQGDYGLADEAFIYRLNKQAALLAKQAAAEMMQLDPSRQRFVAGAMGPTNKTCSLSPRVAEPEFRDIDFRDLVKAYKVQGRALLDGGVDIILIETIIDTVLPRMFSL